MRVGIDAHVLGARAGGNETYMRHLLTALSNHATVPEIFAYVHARGREGDASFGGITPRPALPRNSYLRVLYSLPRLARTDRLDVLHVQYTAPLRLPCPYVVSLHDLVAFHLPESMPFLDRQRLRWLTARTVRGASRIFVLTRAIQQEISRVFNIPADRFDLVQPVADPRFTPRSDPARMNAVRGKYRLPQRYILYVGQLQPRKNLARLAEAFAGLEGLDHKLVIAGRKAWLYREMLDNISRLRLDDRIVFTDYLDYADLPALFCAADAFVYPSLYEGFGIPVLEALGCGVPTVTSLDPAIVEVAAGAALHVDATDVIALREGIRRVLEDDALRRQFRDAGPRRASQFNLEATARAALQGYERAAH